MKSFEQIQKEFEEQEEKMSKKFKTMGKKGQVRSLYQKKLKALIDNPSSYDYDNDMEDFSDE